MAMPLPPLNLNSNASSRSGEAVMSFGPINQPINITYGGKLPWWFWAAGAAGVLWYLKKKKV